MNKMGTRTASRQNSMANSPGRRPPPTEVTATTSKSSEG